METLDIQTTSPHIMNLLHELEELHLLKVLKRNSSGEVSLSNKYAGKLSHKIAESLQEHISKSRN